MIPVDSKACPECGSDDRTGWSDEADQGAADLPAGYEGEEDFDYDAYVQREFAWDRDRGSKPPIPMSQLFGALVAFILIALLIWIFV